MQHVAFIDDDAQIGLQNRKAFRADVERHKGHEVVITIKRKPRRQGTRSMRFYRGVVVPDIALACGYDDPEDWPAVHESLAWKFLRIADHPELGFPRRRSTSKSDLSAQEMTDYISQCIQWAESSIPGCRIRRPDEVDDMESVWAPDYDAQEAA